MFESNKLEISLPVIDVLHLKGKIRATVTEKRN
jgi:hypothetical protein